LEKLLEWYTTAALQIQFESARNVRIRSAECGMRNGTRRVVCQFRTLHSAFRARIVRQLHDVIKIALPVVSPDVQDVHLAGMRTAHRLESLDSSNLPLVRPII